MYKLVHKEIIHEAYQFKHTFIFSRIRNAFHGLLKTKRGFMDQL